jgi:hypothetical protein
VIKTKEGEQQFMKLLDSATSIPSHHTKIIEVPQLSKLSMSQFGHAI